jgi:hypothetical protein
MSSITIKFIVILVNVERAVISIVKCDKFAFESPIIINLYLRNVFVDKNKMARNLAWLLSFWEEFYLLKVRNYLIRLVDKVENVSLNLIHNNSCALV